MTIGKRSFSLTILAVLLILAAVLMLPSCKSSADGESESDDALSMLLEIVESIETTAEADYYVVVIPSDATSALAQKANLLVQKIEEFTGVDSVLEYDNGDNPTRNNAVEIILGNTGRNESRVALAELHVGDYVCKKADQNIVIGGISDEDTIIAVDRFINEILPYSSAEQLMDLNAGFEYFADTSKNILLCGFSIRDFGIVCGSDAKAQEIAVEIKNAVLDKSGSELAVFESQRAGSKDIILEIVKSDSYVGEGYISYNGEDVILRAYDAYGLGAVADQFCSVLLADPQTDEICSSVNWDGYTVECPNNPFNVELVAFDDSVIGFNVADLAVNLYNDMRKAKASMVIVNNMSFDTWDVIRSAMPKEYLYKTLGEEERCAVLYDSTVSEIDLIKSDDNGVERVEIFVTRKNREPSYVVTYIYSDSDSSMAELSATAENAVAERKSDLVLTVHGALSNKDAELPEKSALADHDRVCASGNGWIYVDAFTTQTPTYIESVSCENLKNNGAPLGFLCRVTRISLRYAEFT